MNESVKTIKAKNFEQYRQIKFQTIKGFLGVSVSNLDDKNRRFFQCKKSYNISTDDMIQTICDYLQKVGFDEYEKKGKLIIHCEINGKKGAIYSDELIYI